MELLVDFNRVPQDFVHILTGVSEQSSCFGCRELFEQETFQGSLEQILLNSETSTKRFQCTVVSEIVFKWIEAITIMLDSSYRQWKAARRNPTISTPGIE